MHRQSTIRRLMIFGVATLIGMGIFTGVAAAAPAQKAGRGEDVTRGNHGQTSATKDCDGTHHSKTGHGANDADPHAYNETCDGSPSGNGVGDGEATGKPCAGCVGNADDKNPPGQAPDGPTDHNAGYECDRNQGVGKTNPAHTGCTSTPAEGSDPSDPACPAGAAAMTDHRYLLNGTKNVNDLTGKVKPGDHVKAIFTIASGCADVEVVLESFADRDGNVPFDRDAGTFGAGEHTLDVDIADCLFQVDFYAATNLIDTDEDGSSCGGGQGPGGSGNGNGNGNTNPPSGTPAPPVVLSSGMQQQNPEDAVLGTAVSATRVAPPVVIVHAPVDLVGLSSAASAPRATEVLGIQITNPAASSASLARTGGPVTMPLVFLGGLLCIVGLGLTSVRRIRFA